jgi:hypothetical protein
MDNPNPNDAVDPAHVNPENASVAEENGGFNADGFNADGFNADGFNADGFNANGLNAEQQADYEAFYLLHPEYHSDQGIQPEDR